MNLLISTLANLEDIASKELKHVVKKNLSVIHPSLLLIEKATLTDLYNIAYYSRSINKVVILLKHFTFSSLDDILKEISKINFQPYLKEKFSVSCKRKGNHSFNSQPIIQSTVKIISNKYNIPADYKNPNSIIDINILDNKCFISIDFIGIELSKRYYKVKTSHLDINSSLAFCLIKIAGFNKKKLLLDPFCGNSSIVIEAALSSKNIPNLYNRSNLKIPSKIIASLNKKIDKSKSKVRIFGLDPKYINIKNCRINAKVAQISEAIDFQNYDLEWIDTKFKKKSIDLIVTNPPIITKRNEKDTISMYKQLFYQASYVLKKNGVIVLITTTPELLLEIINEYNFKIDEKRKILIGNLEYTILKCNQKKS